MSPTCLLPPSRLPSFLPAPRVRVCEACPLPCTLWEWGRMMEGAWSAVQATVSPDWVVHTLFLSSSACLYWVEDASGVGAGEANFRGPCLFWLCRAPPAALPYHFQRLPTVAKFPCGKAFPAHSDGKPHISDTSERVLPSNRGRQQPRNFILQGEGGGGEAVRCP